MNIQDIGDEMGCPPGINIFDFAKYIAKQAKLYQWLRDENNWADDSDDWALLGELHGMEFDDFIRAKMERAGMQDVST